MTEKPTSAGMRLQKLLSRAGIASRRKAELLITSGRVSVNGEPCKTLGTRVDPLTDVISVDGDRIEIPRQPFYVLMNKPRGTVCTEKDPEGRERVHDLLPPGLPRLFTIGRLDWDTEGLLLFTTDGELAAALTSPENAVPRIYDVKIQGPPDPDLLRRFNDGVRLDDGRRTKPAPTELARRTETNCWYTVVLTEGMNRQIHRMAMACGKRVLKIRRTDYGPINLEGLKLAKTRPLTDAEVKGLVAAVGLSRKRRAERIEAAALERAAAEAKATTKTGARTKRRKPGPPRKQGGGPPKSGTPRKSGSPRKAGPQRKAGAEQKSGPPQKSGGQSRSGPPQKPGGQQKSGRRGPPRGRPKKP